MVTVGILGASGYAGAELLRLVAGHPELELVAAGADTQAGTPVAEVYPNLAAYHDLVFALMDVDAVDALDVVFALPHGAPQALVPELTGRVKHVVDLAADYRFDEDFVYGLPELYREQVVAADHVAVLPLSHLGGAGAGALVRAGLVEPDGSRRRRERRVGSGAQAGAQHGVLHRGRGLGLRPSRPPAHGRDRAGRRWHGPLSPPHLVPMNRGILATCYARPTAAASQDAVTEALTAAYGGEPFVVVTDEPPRPRPPWGPTSPTSRRATT